MPKWADASQQSVCTSGRMILEDLATGSEASVEEKVLADAFAKKANRTLMEVNVSLWKLMEHYGLNGMSWNLL